jgi:F420-non-reducing hydrogenase small subunit
MSLSPDVYGIVFPRGEIICQEGDRGDTMYVIQSGAVEVSRQSGGESLVLAILEQGDVFGEMALVDQYPRSATVKTITRTRLLPLTRSSFIDRATEDPEISTYLIRVLSQRIERTVRLLRYKLAETPGEDKPLSLLPSEHPETNKVTPPEGQDPAQVSPKNLIGPLAAEHFVEPEKAPLAGMDFFLKNQAGLWFEKGTVIHQESTPSSHMYFILEGSVEIRQPLDEEETAVSLREPGRTFGEVALLTGMPHATTAVAQERTRVVPVNISQLLELVKGNPELALHIVRSLILRLRQILAVLTNPDEFAGMLQQCLPPLVLRRGRLNMALVSLSSCGGCTSVLLDDQQLLEHLLERVDISYCPMLMDQSKIGKADIILVDGIARVKEDEETLNEIRHKGKLLIAWGTCAAFGGIPVLANQYEVEELLEESYGETVDPLSYYLSGSRGMQRFFYQDRDFGMLRNAYPVDSFIRVDYYLPGCPPPLGVLTQFIQELTGGARRTEPPRVVCGECGRKAAKCDLTIARHFPLSSINSQHCFLSQGVLCLGALTRGGCGASCLHGGLPCWGCRGPGGPVLQKVMEGNTYYEVIGDFFKKRLKLEDELLKPVIKLLDQQGPGTLNYYMQLKHQRMRL